MDLTVLQQLIAALSAGHYLGLIMIATLYLRKIASPDSKFPLNVPTEWLPTVSAMGGLAYGFESAIQGGASYGSAALGALAVGASTGFFDGLVTAIFAHGSAPKWAQAIVFLVDDVAGKGGGSASGGAPAVAKAPATVASPNLPPPPASKLGFIGAVAFTTLALAGCLSSAPVVPVTPANQAKVAGCQNTASFHDDIVIGDFVVGGATATFGSIAAIDQNPNDRAVLAVSAVVAAGLTGVGTALAEVTAKNFANSKCTDVVGDLPAAPAPEATK